MDLTKINKNSLLKKEQKPIQKIAHLEKDAKHRILEARIVKTLYGETVLLELEDCVVFLPRRVTEDYRSNITKFNTDEYAIVFRGLFDVGRQNPAASFEIVLN